VNRDDIRVEVSGPWRPVRHNWRATLAIVVFLAAAPPLFYGLFALAEWIGS
jgi:hypothetical protein